MFLDIEALSEAQTNAALGHIYKSLHGHDDDDEIWRHHPSPMVRQIVELFTQRGLDRLESARKEMVAWLAGERHHPTLRRPSPAGMAERWSPAEADVVRIYLEALPPSEWTLNDHMLVIDMIMQRYLSPGELRAEAEWLAVRAALMGKVQAAMGELPAGKATAIAAGLPNTVAGSNTAGIQRAVVELAAQRGAELVTSLADGARHAMRQLVLRQVEKTMTGDTSSPALQTQLVDVFAGLNRDWRRIAVTEATEALCQGFVAAQAPGTRLRRVEQYRNACAWCASIDGRIVTVVDPAAKSKNGDTEVWVGKTNVGRSASPRKRVGNLLVEREPDERWHIAAGAQHPHCRGRWLPVLVDQPGDDPEFGNWLRELLTKREEHA